MIVLGAGLPSCGSNIFERKTRKDSAVLLDTLVTLLNRSSHSAADTEEIMGLSILAPVKPEEVLGLSVGACEGTGELLGLSIGASEETGARVRPSLETLSSSACLFAVFSREITDPPALLAMSGFGSTSRLYPDFPNALEVLPIFSLTQIE
jgi:hypothetical protein